MTEAWLDALETDLAETSRQLSEPGERECLRCYLVRMLDAFGCNGTHRWTERWRDLRAPRATALVERLARRGGICCDCEVILNVYRDYPDSPEPLPCAGVRRAGSTQPCNLGRPGLPAG
jgi:uncharacterized protein DUF2695